MKFNVKKLSMLLSLAMLLSIIAGGFYPIRAYAKVESYNIEKVLQETSDYMVKNKEGFSDAWSVFALVRGGSKDIDSMSDIYLSNLKKELIEKDGVLTTSKYSDYSRAIIVLTSIGVDPRNIQGYNLLENLKDMKEITIQGMNGPLWALLAINSHDYTGPISEETLIAYILENEKPGGGWSLSSEISEVADVDITAMILTSISKYKDRADVKPYIERALDFISKSQQANGGFETLSTLNSESSSQVIIALSSLKIDLTKDPRFIKNGNNVIDTLIHNFYNGNGGFLHIENGKVDKIATEQALMALTAYSRFKEDKPGLYDMTDLAISVVDYEEIEVEETANPFIDIENDIEKVEIIELSKMGIIKGVTEWEFMPNKSITRAEFATLLTRALKLKENHNHGFSDVKSSDWFSASVGAAKESGLIKGYPDNTFKPNNNISREEAAMIIYNAAKDIGNPTKMEETELRNYLSQFPDYLEIADWSRLAMGYGVKKNFIRNEILNIEPKRVATRSEVAGMLFRFLKDI